MGRIRIAMIIHFIQQKFCMEIFKLFDRVKSSLTNFFLSEEFINNLALFWTMAKLRKFAAYRRRDRLKRAYTRFSKYTKFSYVKARPHSKLARLDWGDTKGKYSRQFDLLTKHTLQIRDNALESARQVINRCLERALGKTGWAMKVRVYPHHILRENPLASGAGADRLSTGMAHSYGKPIGVAAQLHAGQPVFSVYVEEENIPLARQALRKAAFKLPCSCTVAEA